MQRVMNSQSAKSVFFVASTARSGSTSLARILDSAANARCVTEPFPNLNRETRDMMDGRIADPLAALERAFLPRVREAAKQVPLHGEKDVTYAPFIRYLHEELDCKFVFLKRDGRDVVRSLLDWHNRKFGSIYRECRDPGDLTAGALAAAAALPVHLDTSDYSRPRPARGDALFEKWEQLSRFEMCAYYWARINDLYLDELERIPAAAWTTLDYTAPTADGIVRVAGFLGLAGISKDAVQEMLDRRINSLQERGDTAGVAFPNWRAWSPELQSTFDALAAGTMARLGYAPEPETVSSAHV